MTAHPPLVQIFDVVSWGRTLFRTLAFTSDDRFSLHEPASELLPPPDSPPHLRWRGDMTAPPPAAGPSLVISRSLGSGAGLGAANSGGCGGSGRGAAGGHLSQQTYVPRRFLNGLLPDALLDAYMFWQSDEPEPDGAVLLVGFETAATAQAAVVHRRAPAESTVLDLAS